jgi:hypothetical protein
VFFGTVHRLWMFRGLVENKSRNVGLGACGKQTRCCWCRYFELQVNFLFFFLKKKKRKKKRREKKCYQTKLPIVNELGLVDERGYYLHQMQLIK